MSLDDRVHTNRARAESFGSAAAEYDRHRPSYPAELIDDLAALHPAAVLDVGCGTGKAATLLAARGLRVLGVEVDARMAAVARRNGVAVEVGAFETWADRGRRFDLVTCAQAWHWIDPTVGAVRVAELLRPGGTLALFWSYHELDAGIGAAVHEVYREFAPELTRSVVLGVGRPSERPYAAELEGSGRFVRVQLRSYPWQLTRTAAQWLALAGTHSDHLALAPRRRERLLAVLADVLAARGGTITSHYVTSAVFACVPS